MIRIFEDRIEITEIINDDKSIKTYYEIDSEIGQKLIKDNNLEVEGATE